MFQKILKVSLLSLVVTLLPSNFQIANANEILWNPTLSGSWEKPADLVPGAQLKSQGVKVYKSNPDEMILQIQMAQSFEDRPFSGKGRNIAIWLYWPKDWCFSKEDANCEGLFVVAPPDNPATYPSVKSSEYIFVERHDKASNVNKKITECKAPWWIDSTFSYRDTLNFAVSITCLGLPKSFGTYAYSSIDIGQSKPATQFTPHNDISYPFHELAAKFGQTSANLNEKSELIDGLKKLSISGSAQSKSLKALIKSTKLSAAKKKTYTATIKSYDNHIKTYNKQISELESLPFGETLKSLASTFIQSHQIWLKKLMDILDGMVGK